MLATDQERLRQDIAAWVEHFGRDRSYLIPILQRIQHDYAQVSELAMQVVADHLGMHPAEVYGVVSFNPFLSGSPRGRFIIRLCRSICCDMANKDVVARQLEDDLGITFGQTTADGCFTLEWTSCMGMCDQGPALLVNERVYTRATPAKVSEMVHTYRAAFDNGNPQSQDGQAMAIPSGYTGPLTFASHEIDSGLRAALGRSRAVVIDDVSASRLRPCRTDGCTTGTSWSMVATVPGATRCVVCGADEGDPGSFNARALLTDHADLVIEGMTIAGYAIGATKGIIYVRGEYEYLRTHLEAVLDGRRRKALLGSEVAGKSGFAFDVEIRMGSGAYACGEETAVIETLKGHRGEPRYSQLSPLSAEAGRSPLIVNDAETLAWVACICARGAEWFRNVGTGLSSGPRVFSISGDCTQPGLYEFPLGTTISALLDSVGGTHAKAVLVGGALGPCIPASAFRRRIAYEDVPPGGSVIVIGPHRNMLEVARDLLEFFAGASCGQCTPCREGIPRLLEGVECLLRGSRPRTHLMELIALGESMQLSSKCRIGQSAPDTFLFVAQNLRNGNKL